MHFKFIALTERIVSNFSIFTNFLVNNIVEGFCFQV